MTRQRIELDWEVGWHTEREGEPEEWVSATVPGAVQLDWARAHDWPPHWIGGNPRQYEWMEDVYWTYRTKMPQVEITENEKLYLVCGGVDYKYEVLIGFERRPPSRLLPGPTERDGIEGMFTRLDVYMGGLQSRTEVREMEVRVRVHPAPKSRATPIDRSQANHSCKPAVSYGWDFHPRLVPLGIWRETYLEVRPLRFFRDVEISYRLADDLGSAELRVREDTSKLPVSSEPTARMRWRLLDAEGNAVIEQEQPAHSGAHFDAKLDTLQLWWPHDQGTPYLYTSRVDLLDASGALLDRHEQKIGFRRVKLVMHPTAWEQPQDFPKGRSDAPITLEINGRPLFCKGANWVTPDIFIGTLTRERYREQLELVRGANMNLLRMWGGAGVQKPEFFELCDELGIMVWQEFPLACNLYPDDPDYLKVLDTESKSIIGQLKPHPSMVMWCGGNELFNSWSGMTDQSLPLRLLNRNCYDLDRSRPFLMTSPLVGMGHGNYVFQDAQNGEEAVQAFMRSHCTAYTEFGCPGPADADTLREIIPPEELFPPREGTAWETHHAFGAWQPNSWLGLNIIERYCGPSATLEELVEKGQRLQAEGYRGLFEEARRQKPTASMALNWCLNEPWPCAANNSLIVWPCKPKPALKAVGEACRPTLFSARIPKYLWREEEWFDPEVWLLSDAPEAIDEIEVEVVLVAGGREILLLRWQCPATEANRNRRGPKAGVALPRFDGERIELHLRCTSRPELNSVYTLAYRRIGHEEEPVGGTRTMNL